MVGKGVGEVVLIPWMTFDSARRLVEEQEHSEEEVVVVEELGHLLTEQQELVVGVPCVKVLTW